MRPLVFLGDSRRDVTRGVCRVTLQLGHWVVFHMGYGTTCSTFVVWLRPSQEARLRHHSAPQQSTVEPKT